MVLFRRTKGERAERVLLDDGVELGIEELRKAEKLPTFADGEVCRVVSDEVLGWVILNAETWRPKRNPSAYRGLTFRRPDRLEMDGKIYDGVIFMDDGRLFLADGAVMRIMADSDGTKTVNDIVAEMVAEAAKANEDVKRALEENDEKKLMSLYSALYCTFAMLKERGLLI